MNHLCPSFRSFLLSALSTAFFFLAIALLYFTFGTTNYDSLSFISLFLILLFSFAAYHHLLILLLFVIPSLLLCPWLGY